MLNMLVFFFQEKEGEEKAYLDNSDLGFLPSLLKTKSFRVCVSKYLWWQNSYIGKF